ncbi:chemotaxis protein CheW [candidate division CSSED10-310 bacterium]|uniref:Chemotaxis protein CheW n=1 Tax=candidate division CSSED10-310 bacterium TaxID=2855610 RepID=A0ABV6YZ55_UNCC1
MMEWPQSIMIFTVDQKLFGVPLAKLEKILHAQSQVVYPVQVNLPSLYGYCQVENDFVPLIDIRILLRKITVEPTKETSILVTLINTHLVGLLCDSVRSVINPETVLVKLPSPLLLEAKDYFGGVFLHQDEMILLFNPQTLFREGDLHLMATTGEHVQQNITVLDKGSLP